MKKILLLLIPAMVLLSGCKKDENEGPEVTNLTEWTVDYSSDPNVMDMSFITGNKGTGKIALQSYVFNYKYTKTAATTVFSLGKSAKSGVADFTNSTATTFFKMANFFDFTDGSFTVELLSAGQAKVTYKLNKKDGVYYTNTFTATPK